MFKMICTVLGVATFVVFMSLVGNPHVVETIIGICLGCFVGFGLYFSRTKKQED